MQLAGWIGTAGIPWMLGIIPARAGTWFCMFPNVQTFGGQTLAVPFVGGSYSIHRLRTYGGWNPA